MKQFNNLFIIFFTLSAIKNISSIEYHLKRYPLFAATPSEFANVVSSENQNIVFDSSKNRQFCAIEIEWFNESQVVKKEIQLIKETWSKIRVYCK